MSVFTTRLRLEFCDDGRFELTEPFIYEIGGLGTGTSVFVPEGFRTDFASIPKLFHSILSPIDPSFARAAVVHDRLYQQAVNRTISDAIFLEAMCVLHCPVWKRSVVYFAVRLFGWIAWQRYADAKSKTRVDLQTSLERTIQAEQIDDTASVHGHDGDEARQVHVGSLNAGSASGEGKTQRWRRPD